MGEDRAHNVRTLLRSGVLMKTRAWQRAISRSFVILLVSSVSEANEPTSAESRKSTSDDERVHWVPLQYPSIRFGLGKDWRARDGEGGFHFDLTVGPIRGWYHRTEGEYYGQNATTLSYGIRPDVGFQHLNYKPAGNYLLAGIGPFVGYQAFTLQYTPRFMLGWEGGAAVGFSHGLTISLAMVMGVEFSESYRSSLDASSGGGREHTRSILFVFDEGIIIAAMGCRPSPAPAGGRTVTPEPSHGEPAEGGTSRDGR